MYAKTLVNSPKDLQLFFMMLYRGHFEFIKVHNNKCLTKFDLIDYNSSVLMLDTQTA